MKAEKNVSDKEFMLSVLDWPHWPLLPIKRYVGHRLETGLLVAAAGHNSPKKQVMFVRDANIFSYNGTPKPVPTNVDLLIKEGWVVD